MFIYLIQVALVFSVLYLLYILFLQKLTFHSLNRCVLLAIVPISVTIPFLADLFPALSSRIIEVPLFEPITFGAVNEQLKFIEQPLVDASFNYATALITIYWFVFSIYIIRILINSVQIVALKNNATIHQNNGYQIIVANVAEIFSYFNWVFIPIHQFEQYDPKILEHEKVHIQLKHSWDVMLTEVYIAFFWFNPLHYFYRKSLKSIHEFQADNGVLENGVKTSHYLKLLMQSLEIQKPNNLYNYFNQPILKKRIAMMTKSKSNRISKFTYLLFLPVFVFLILAFTSPIIENNEYLNIMNVSEFEYGTPSLVPVNFTTDARITSRFNSLKRPSTHTGIMHGGVDYVVKSGAPVMATANGIITKASMEGNWGNLIVIKHADGYETWYAHLKGFNIKENQIVEKGAIIGYVGNTGVSSGPHLHYEVRQNGKRLNPIDYFK